MTQFEVGKTYYARSICDYECIHTCAIISRTAKSITTKVHGNVVARRLTVRDGIEEFKPFGSYSMAAVIKADRVQS